MPAQTSIPPAANVLGTIGTDAGAYRWCLSKYHSIPVSAVRQLKVQRIWHNWRKKKTDGLPGLMVMLWASCAVPFGVYAIVQNFNIPLQAQPQCFGLLCLITWGQTLVYHDGWRTWTAVLVTSLLAIAFGVVELILVLTIRGPYHKGVSWPLTMMAIIASVILAVGLIPPYFELAKRGGRVIGINFIFLTIDWSGAFFSLMALVAQNTFDYLGGSLYIVCMFLELGIFASQIVWLFRTRRVRGAAKKAGKTYDEYIADETQGRSSVDSQPHISESIKTLGKYPGESYETISQTIAALEKCKIKPTCHTASPSPMYDILDLEAGTLDSSSVNVMKVRSLENLRMVPKSAGRA